MENKIKLMHKIMSVLLVASLMFWSVVTYGLVSVNTLVLLAILAFVLISMKRHAADERDWQIHFLATYGSFMATVCFLLVFQTVEYMKGGKVSPLGGYILGVLMVSQAVFSGIFRKVWK